jgi:hypothetical protein
MVVVSPPVDLAGAYRSEAMAFADARRRQPRGGGGDTIEAAGRFVESSAIRICAGRTPAGGGNRVAAPAQAARVRRPQVQLAMCWSLPLWRTGEKFLDNDEVPG